MSLKQFSNRSIWTKNWYRQSFAAKKKTITLIIDLSKNNKLICYQQKKKNGVEKYSTGTAALTLIWTIFVVEMRRRLNFNETDDAVINGVDFFNTMLLVRLANMDNGYIACWKRFVLFQFFLYVHESNGSSKFKAAAAERNTRDFVDFIVGLYCWNLKMQNNHLNFNVFVIVPIN